MTYRSLSRDDARHERRKLATLFAFEAYQAEHPGCDPDEAFAHAERAWPAYTGRALDFMALSDALAEAKAAAPSN